MSELDKVSHELNHASEIVAYLNRNEALKDPTLRRDYFEHLSPEDFVGFTQQIAAGIQHGDPDTPAPYDGVTVSLQLHEVPDQRDKEDLVKETWQTALGFLKDRSLNDEDALIYAGLVSAGAFLLTHPYMDGNGRTSRVMSYAIIKGVTADAPADIEALLKKRTLLQEKLPTGLDAWETTPPPVVSNAAYDVSFPFNENAEIVKTINGSSKELTEGTLDIDDPVWKAFDSYNNDYVIAAFLDNADSAIQKIIEPYIERDEKGAIVQFVAADALHALEMDEQHGIEYTAQLLEAERWYRKQFVSNFLKAMTDTVPSKPVDDVERRIAEWSEDGIRKEQTYKGRFPLKLRTLQDKHTARQAAVAKYAVNGLITTRDRYRLQHEVDSAIMRRKNLE